MPDLNDRISEAPTSPGVYLFANTSGRVIYVGKANDLRRRLRDHLRTGARFLRAADSVGWFECRDEMDALAREADLICSLRPRYNRAIRADASFSYVCVDGSRMRLVERPLGADNYGAFFHLGKGKAYTVAVRMNAGLTALLRLLWVAYGDDRTRFRLPSALRGTSPPVDHVTPAPSEKLRPLLSGETNILLRDVQDEMAELEVPPHMERPLFDDLIAADAFYRLGPRSLRDMRDRHGLAHDPLDVPTIRSLIAAEVG